MTTPKKNGKKRSNGSARQIEHHIYYYEPLRAAGTFLFWGFVGYILGRRVGALHQPK